MSVRGGRPSSKGQYIDQVREMYLMEKMSLSEIAREINKSIATVSSWIKSEGIQLEPRPRNPNEGRTADQQAEINERIRKSIATSPARQEHPGGRPRVLKREIRVCPVDGKEFEARVSDAQEFCTLACARVSQGREYAAHKEQEWLESSKSACACGETIPYSLRRRRFCSTKCAQEYGGVRKPDPANYRTRHCANEQCGKEFTRYLKYGNGDTRFCSNACARKHTKTRRFYAVEDFEIVFESSYECAFWGMCKIAKIPIERFDREHGVAWGDEDHPDRWYAPDFWLPDYEVAVEIKGHEDDHDEARWSAYRRDGSRLMVFDRERLMRFSPGELDTQVRRNFNLERYPEELRMIAPK